MSRGGHNWQGGGTVERTRSLSVTKLARAGLLAGHCLSGWQWTHEGETTASIQIECGRDALTLHYRSRASGDDWQSSPSACRSVGFLAGSGVNGPGLSAMFTPMGSIAVGGLPTFTVVAGSSLAGTATAWGMESSVTLRSIRPTVS
jgi:hypothetical protein